MAREWNRDYDDEPAVRAVLHEPERPSGDGIVLAHGASGNRDQALLVALAEAFAERGLAALRCDLPYRQRRPKGPPSPAGMERDREGLRRALQSLEEAVPERRFLGGSSYGGRQASMLAAAEPDLAAALLLLSYPLHPPGRPERLRTEHFPQLRTPALFAHGTRDGFGSIAELEAAFGLLAGPHRLLVFEGAGHGLKATRKTAETAADAFLAFVN